MHNFWTYHDLELIIWLDTFIMKKSRKTKRYFTQTQEFLNNCFSFTIRLPMHWIFLLECKLVYILELKTAIKLYDTSVSFGETPSKLHVHVSQDNRNYKNSFARLIFHVNNFHFGIIKQYVFSNCGEKYLHTKSQK